MSKKIPSCIRIIEQSDDSVLLEFLLDKDLFWFRGHFPVQPILPGVAQLDWVTKLANEHKLIEGSLKNIRQIKFTVPMVPQDRVRLLLSSEKGSETKGLSFTYKVLKDTEWITTSQGKVSA